jgi:thymidylate synthase (FAD)
MKSIGVRPGLFGDVGKVEMFDFSMANRSKESRVEAITTVASICFNGKSIGSEKLYSKLYAESIGLPSSSFEFVPVLLNREDTGEIYTRLAEGGNGEIPNIGRYGRFIGDNLLTNLRAVLYDVRKIEQLTGHEIDIDNRFFNDDPGECNIIMENMLFFRSNIDIVTARQFMRHRVSWQELSRRYVSGNKVPFSVYLTDDMYDKDVSIEVNGEKVGSRELVDMTILMYETALSKGVKPQDARRIIPQGSMTTMWSAWHKDQFDAFVELRTASKAQWEIRKLSEAMRDMAFDLKSCH